MKKSDQYNGAELSDYDGRTGAMQAKYLPSRRGDLLHWPDGTITDMDGRKAKEQERAYTLPVIPTRYELAQAKKSGRQAAG